MNHHWLGACVALLLVGVTSAGLPGCADPDSVTNDSENVTSGEGEAFVARVETTDGSIAEMQTASRDVSAIVDHIFVSIEKGADEELYEFSTATRFQQVTDLKKWKSICGRVRSRLGALKTKQSSRFDINTVQGTRVASASYQAKFAHGAGTIFVILEKSNDDWLLLRFNVNAPELLDDPTQYRERVEVFVENSDPVLPGTMVDILDSTTKPAKIIVKNTRIENVRWKVDNPFVSPMFPARGFVTMGLTKEQSRAVSAAGTVSVKRHKKAEKKSAIKE